MTSITPIILAGGSGTRLWPLSRSAYPKQFLPLLSEEETLLQSTVRRVLNQPNVSAPMVVCHEDHRFIVAEQLRQMGVKPQAIILEPEPRNTAPAIALAALYFQKSRPEEVLWVMPADHSMRDLDQLWKAYCEVQPFVEAGSLATFGIKAVRPDTGYGYIKASDALPGNTVYAVDGFVEKPNEEKAAAYVASGDYYWNSGMFAFKAEAYLDQLKAFEPKMLSCCRLAMESAVHDGDFTRPSNEALADCPEDSIDYAVMEKTDRAVVTVLDLPWSDVGSWGALMAEHVPDVAGNVVSGDVFVDQVRDSYLRSDHGVLAVTGVENIVVVVTQDAVLVADRTHTQSVKTLVSALKEKERSEVALHQTVHRPWGSYQTLALGEHFQVKKITVKPGEKLSLQRHRYRSEHWVVVSGVASVVNGETSLTLKQNESTFIPLQAMHRLANDTNEALEIIEVQVGSYLGEDDIERFSDDYGRG